MGNTVYDNNGNLIYRENSNGFWVKYDYDDNGNEIYCENSNGEQIHYII
jgi:YD repeat-containing protein